MQEAVMKGSSETNREARRAFLKGVVVASGVASGGLLRSAEAVEALAAEAPSADQTKPQGYRVTEHVRRYYEKARF
jgi:hypothetical protein